MKSLMILVCLILAGLVLPAQAEQAEDNVQSFTINNGMKIIVKVNS